MKKLKHKFDRYSFDRELQKEMMQEYEEFQKTFLLHFAEDERAKIQEFLDDAIEVLDSTIIHVYPDFLWNELFTKEVQKSGSFAYKEFSSMEEIENWDSSEKISKVALMIVISRKSLDEIKIDDLGKIHHDVNSHFIENMESGDGIFYCDFKFDKNSQTPSYHLLYHKP